MAGLGGKRHSAFGARQQQVLSSNSPDAAPGKMASFITSLPNR
jgi:hypothetical protein